MLVKKKKKKSKDGRLIKAAHFVMVTRDDKGQDSRDVPGVSVEQRESSRKSVTRVCTTREHNPPPRTVFWELLNSTYLST